MRADSIRRLIGKYVKETQTRGGPRPPEFYAHVLIGPPCPKDTDREAWFANEERWDWWRTSGRRAN